MRNGLLLLFLSVPFCSSMDLGLPSKMEESLHFSQPAVTPYTPAHFTEPSVPVSLAPYLLSDDITAQVTQDTQTSVIHRKHHDISVDTLIENPSTNTNHHAASPTIISSHLPFLPSFPGETESSGSQWQYQGSFPTSDKVSLTDMTSGKILWWEWIKVRIMWINIKFLKLK